jgi:RimJ/RimL family protein N-acetyltransferase
MASTVGGWTTGRSPDEHMIAEVALPMVMTRQQPTIQTKRLVLRPWALDDAPVMQRLAGRREIADTMISIPHPYTEQQVREWIAGHDGAFTQGKAIHFAIQLKGAGQLMGATELRAIDTEHAHAELSAWIGVEWWGQGYASEAARAVVRYGFEHLNLNRIHACYTVRNPASGRVLEQVGMKREGLLRQCVRKWGVFEDVVLMAIIRQDWTGHSFMR